jgi:hypothetical protein
MQRWEGIKRVVSKKAIAKALGLDKRRKALEAIRPDVVLVIGKREFPLYDSRIPSALAVTKPL